MKREFPFYIEYSRNKSGCINPDIRFRREFWKISYFPKSSGEYIVNNRVYKYVPGSIILTHPNAWTTYSFEGAEMNCFNLLFSLGFIEDYLSGLQDDFGFCSIFSKDFPVQERDSVYVLKCDSEMRRLIMSINREFRRKNVNYRESIRHLLLNLIIEMMRQSAERGFAMTPDELADYVDNYLHEHFREEFKLPRLARRIGLSPCYLSKAYSKKTGGTIIAKLKRIRLEAAECELRHSCMSIAEVCYHCGFNDLSYFYRSFRQYFGIRPGDVQRSSG